MKSTKQEICQVLHAQKILVGSSSKFTAGYLVIKGQYIEKFIPESAGIGSLSEEERKSIIEVKPYQYVIPGIIDTNVSLHNECYDKEWADSKYFSMLALQNGITTLINQSLLKQNQQDSNNAPNGDIPQGLDFNSKAEPKYQDSNSEKKQYHLSRSGEQQKLEQNQLKLNTKHQESQIFSEENETKRLKGNEDFPQIIENNNLSENMAILNEEKRDSLADLFSDEKDRIGCGSDVEPSTNSLTPSCVLKNKTKTQIKTNNNKNNGYEFYCDCLNIQIPEKKVVIQLQKGGKITADMETQKLSKNFDGNISSCSLKSEEQKSKFIKEQNKMIRNKSPNKFKIYTSPPVDPNVPFFTKPEQIAAFIKDIVEKNEFKNQEEEEENNSDDSYEDYSYFEKSYESSQINKYFNEIDQPNDFLSQDTNLDLEKIKLKQSNVTLNFPNIPQQTEQSYNPFQILNQANSMSLSRLNENGSGGEQNSDFPLIKNNESNERFYYNNEIQLSIIPEQLSQQTENNSNTHIAELDSKLSNYLSSTSTYTSQNIKKTVSYNSIQNFNQRSLIIQEEDEEQCAGKINQEYTLQKQRIQEGEINLKQNPLKSKDNSNREEETQREKENGSSQKINEGENNNIRSDNISECNYQAIKLNQDNSNDKNKGHIDLENTTNNQHTNQCADEQQCNTNRQNNGFNIDFIESQGIEKQSFTNKIEKELQQQKMEEIEENIQKKELQQKKDKRQRSKLSNQSKIQNSHPIFFIHPSSQQGDNNLSLSSPFRQQNFAERMMFQKSPPKIGGDALRAPFERDYEETINDLKQIQTNQEDYDEGLKQFLYEIFEASKENSKEYTDHLISHSQLSDYNSELLDDNDKNESYNFQLDKQSLQWPQPAQKLKFDKERSYFNQECNNYLPNKAMFESDQETQIECGKLADSQYFANDEVRESQLNLSQQYQSVIQLDEVEPNEVINRQQIEQDSGTFTSIRESIFSKTSIAPLRLNTFKDTAQILPEGQQIDSRISVQSGLMLNQINQFQDCNTDVTAQNDDNVNKESSPKEDGSEASIKEHNFIFEVGQGGEPNIANLKVDCSLKPLKEQLSPMHLLQNKLRTIMDGIEFKKIIKSNNNQNLQTIEQLELVTDSSNEGVKNNEPPYQNQIGGLMGSWKNSPFNRSNSKAQNQIQQNLTFDLKKEGQQPYLLSPQIDHEQKAEQLSCLDTFGVRKVDSVCENESDYEDSEVQNKNQKDNIKNNDQQVAQKLFEDQADCIQISTQSLEYVSKHEENKNKHQFQEDLAIKEQKNESAQKINTELAGEQLKTTGQQQQQDEEVCVSQVKRRIALQKLSMQNSLSVQINEELFDEKNKITEKQQQQKDEKVCESQVKRRVTLQKLDMSMNKPHTSQEIKKQTSFSHRISDSNPHFGFNLAQNAISLNNKVQSDGIQTKSNMSLMERRQKSSMMQSINLDTSKSVTKPIAVANNPKADYLHFLSARPFFWEYYALQMYNQVFRNLFIQMDKVKQTSKSLTSSPQTNILNGLQSYQSVGPANSTGEENLLLKECHLSIQNPSAAAQSRASWKGRAISFSSGKNTIRPHKQKSKSQIGTFIFQNISNGLSVVRIFSMKKTFERLADISTEVSWPFLFFDSTQITPGDSRFKTEPAIQNLQNKQILQSCLFNNPHLINMVGSYHFTVPPKFKFFAQQQQQHQQNLTLSQAVSSLQTPMTVQNDKQFPGDFQRAINGLFSLGGQISALWTIAMAQKQSKKSKSNVRTPLRSKSSSFSFGFQQRNNNQLPVLTSTPSIFKMQMPQIDTSDQQNHNDGDGDNNNDDAVNDVQNDEIDSQCENNPHTQNQAICNKTHAIANHKSTFYEREKGEDTLKNCIQNMIEQNQMENLTSSENQSPLSQTKYEMNIEYGQENKLNEIITMNEEIGSIKTDSNNSSPKAFSFQQQQQQKQLTDQEEQRLIRIIDVLSRNPSKICDLKNKGSLDEGKHADILIFDPHICYEFSAKIDEKQKFPSQLHILNSQKVQGKVITTFIRGQKVYEEHKFYLDDFIPNEELYYQQ